MEHRISRGFDDGPDLDSALGLLSSVFQDAVASAGAVGAVAAVRLASGTWLTLAAGKDTTSQCAETPNPQAAYPLFSLAKTVMAAAVLRLRDAQQLKLRQSVGDFSGGEGRFPAWLASAKIIDLLRHTRPLPEYTDLKSYHDAVIRNPGNPWTTDQVFQAVESIRSTTAESPGDSQGQRWAYCNTGYWALGRVIENVARAPLSDALRSLVFQPLKLSSLSYGIAEHAVLGPTHSSYLSGGGREVECSTLYDPLWAGPAGGVVGRVCDYGRFSEALLVEESFLSRSSLDQMLTRLPLGEPHFPAKYKIGYGLGLFFDSGSPIGVLAGHGGSGPGCHTIAKTVVSSGAIVVLASNSERADPDRLAMPLLKLANTMS